MKNVKTMYRKLTMMVVLGVLLAVMSCNNLLTPPKGNSTDRDSGSGNVSEDGKVLITIKLFTGSARMVMPDIEQLDWNITAEQRTDSIPATGTYPTYTLELPTTGSWTFTVKGTKENKELFTGTVTKNVSNSTTSISIPLSPGSGMTDGGATGKLNLTIKPENVLNMTVSYRVDGGTWCNNISGTYPVGQHTLDLYFSKGSEFYFCTVAVNIWPGMTSDRWINTNGEEYINDNGEFVITKEMVNEFVKTMGSVVFVDARVDADTPATGSIFAPVRTVSTAVDILRKANPRGNYNGTIMVSMATTITHEVQVRSGETLTVKGTGTGASVTNDKGRVFSIASGGSLTLGENITLTGTYDTGNGGAVYVDGGTFTMEAGSKITGSRAQNGGGVYIDSGTFTMSDTATIQNNTATTHGGGVYVDGTFSVSGSPTITGNIGSGKGNNVYLPSGKTITCNSQGLTGGTIGVTAEKVLSGSAVQITNGDVNGAAGIFTSDTSVGAVHSINGDVYMVDTTPGRAPEVAYLDTNGTINFDTFNTAHGAKGREITLLKDITPTTAPTVSWPIAFDWICTLDLNGYTIDRKLTSATPDGSVIKIKGIYTLTIKDSSATNPDGTGGTGAITGGYNSGYSEGGGIVIKDYSGGSLILESGNIKGNSSHNSGGGVYIGIRCFFTMKGGKIDSNKVTMSSGGGVGVNQFGTFTMSGGTIDNNTASKDGGGVYIVSSGIFTMSGGTIDNNTASKDGGGVYIDSGIFTMSGGTISGNTATQDGGGVYVKKGSTFKKQGGTVSNNTPNDVIDNTL